MSALLERYILCSEIVTPSGFNHDLAMAIASADLGLFENRVDSRDNESKPVAKIDFISETEQTVRVLCMLEMVLKGVLVNVPTFLLPLPLIITVPICISKETLIEWISDSQYSHSIADIHLMHDSGIELLDTLISRLTDSDALIGVSIDMPIAEFDALSESSALYSSKNPWGLIPGEAAAGVVVTKQAVLDTLKIKPQSQIKSFFAERGQNDGRSCSRLVRKNSQYFNNFGKIYSDMTCHRHHVEDYGFAIGARSECFPAPDEVKQTNEHWGFLGNASALTTLCVASRDDARSEQLATLFLFDNQHNRAILTLSKRACCK